MYNYINCTFKEQLHCSPADFKNSVLQSMLHVDERMIQGIFYCLEQLVHLKQSTRCSLCRQESHAIPQRCKSKGKTSAIFKKNQSINITPPLLKEWEIQGSPYSMELHLACRAVFVSLLIATPLPGRILCGTQVHHLPVNHFLIEQVQCFIYLFLFQPAYRLLP